MHQQVAEVCRIGGEQLPNVDGRLNQKPGTSAGKGYKERWSVFRRFQLSVQGGKGGGDGAAGSETDMCVCTVVYYSVITSIMLHIQYCGTHSKHPRLLCQESHAHPHHEVKRPGKIR